MKLIADSQSLAALIILERKPCYGGGKGIELAYDLSSNPLRCYHDIGRHGWR